jgi:peptidoglycan/LPS O-acetylase OafA/YrhL
MEPAFPHPNSPQYRPDIDGLRAVAVLSVVAYHAFPGKLPGGFLGVDVFFVISGYLISTIILKNLDTGAFSVTEFYARRVRRIFPALLAVLVASYAFGWLALLADEYAQLGKHIAAGAGFVSNLVLWNEVGYFDRSAETKPLLHLWSLGIEEQFYLAWPLLLWFCWRRRFVLPVILALAAFSLFATVIWSNVDAVATFYSPATRFWELLSGSLLAWIALRRARLRSTAGADSVPAAPIEIRHAEMLANALSVVGLAMLAWAFASIAGDMNSSPKAVGAAVTGAGFTIAAGPQAWVNRLILSNRLVVWFGLISFPLYLWHWPLLSFARIVAGKTPGAALCAAAIACALVLSWLTYRLVERPVRFGANPQRKTAICLMLMTGVCGIGLYTYGTGGIGDRRVAQINSKMMSGSDGGTRGLSVNECDITDRAERELLVFCARDRRGNIQYALLGDSKAASLYPALLRTSTGSARWMFVGGSATRVAPPVPVLSDDPRMSRFQPATKVAVRTIEQNPQVQKVVIVAAIRSLFQLSDGVKNGNFAMYDHRYLEQLSHSGNYDLALEGLSRTISRFVRKHKKVVLVVDNPALPSPEDCLGRKTSIELVNRLLSTNEECVGRLDVFNAQIATYRKLLAELESRYRGDVEIFDPTDIYCDVDRGTCASNHDGRLLYSVTDHISDYAAGLVATRLNKVLEEDSSDLPRRGHQ